MNKYKVVYQYSLTRKEAILNDLELAELRANTVVQIIECKKIGTESYAEYKARKGNKE